MFILHLKGGTDSYEKNTYTFGRNRKKHALNRPCKKSLQER